jgi:5'-methylthioadenosine phosphorylase
MILSTLKANIGLSKEIIRLAVTRMPQTRDCACANALENAIVTPLKQVPAEQKKKLGLLIDKYI